MNILKSKRGFSMLEMLISLAVFSVIIAAVFVAYTGSLRVFKDVKSVSDDIENKTPSIELVARYFDRWGIGVVSQYENQYCSNCPSRQRAITIAAPVGDGTCADVTFYGNLYGIGFVQDKINTSATGTRVLSCRLNTSANQNCYTLWRNNSPLNEPQIAPNGNLVMLSLASLSSNDADCADVSAGTNYNITMDDDMVPSTGFTGSTLVVQAGDMIQRAAHRIRLYCAANANDNSRQWLYAAVTEAYGTTSCNESYTSAIAPVNGFTVTAIAENPLPTGTVCNSATGGTGCGAVSVNITFRSQSSKYSAQTYDTMSVSKVFGRVKQGAN